MTERGVFFSEVAVNTEVFSRNLRPIGRERGWLDVRQLAVSMHYGKEDGAAEESLRVTISYHGHPGYSARFVNHGEELELVEMREVFGGRGKSIHVGLKSPEVIRDVIMPALSQTGAPWKRLTMGPVINIAGVTEMGGGEQQRMLLHLPTIFSMQPVGQGFVHTITR